MNRKKEQNEYAEKVQRRWEEIDEEMCLEKCGEKWRGHEEDSTGDTTGEVFLEEGVP